jgi:LysM repeat protein
MRKLLFCLLIAVVFAGLSCKSAPAEMESGIAGELTQQQVDNALKQIYGAYQAKLDMSGSQDYTVVWGDTLSKITRRYYGGLTNVGEAGSLNGFYFPIIMLASPDSHIVDPDMIYPGVKLKIIDLERNLANPEAHQAIKDSLMDIAHVYQTKNKLAEETGLIKLSNSL